MPLACIGVLASPGCRFAQPPATSCRPFGMGRCRTRTPARPTDWPFALRSRAGGPPLRRRLHPEARQHRLENRAAVDAAEALVAGALRVRHQAEDVALAIAN